MNTATELTVDTQATFADLVEQGVRAYMHASELHYITQGVQYIAEEALMGSSTLDSWRSKTTPRFPRDYETLQRFASVCLKAAPELGETWLTNLFREAGMAGYRDQALAKILRIQRILPKFAPRSGDFEAGRRINITGTIPALPDYYVPRQAKLEALKALALGQGKTGGWIAILGMTGVGKSTLLAALGYDATIQATFAENVRWFEVRQSTTPQRLAQRIAQAFGQELPKDSDAVADMVAALRRTLPDGPILLLLDNVVDPAIISPLHALGPQVMVVVTIRTVQDAAALRVPEKAWITIGELEPAEAWALVEQIAPVAEEQREAAQTVLALLEYHPYITVVAASAALTLKLAWTEIQEIITSLARRSQAQRLLIPANASLWVALEMDWEKLDAQRQYALATLGRLPYFSRYDLALAQAAWGLSAQEALVAWKILVAMQLARPAPEPAGEYTVHWLIRDFAADKARQWSWWQRLRFLGWPWRYRLPFRLRFWWPALPQPATAIHWPWWSLQMPGTEDIPGWRPIFVWLTGTIWRQDGRQLNLRAGPVEWVTVLRLSVRLLTANLAMLCLVVAAGLQNQMLLGSVAMVAMLWVIAVTFVDLRRAVLWWGLEKPLPLPAAFLNKRKGPAS